MSGSFRSTATRGGGGGGVGTVACGLLVLLGVTACPLFTLFWLQHGPLPEGRDDWTFPRFYCSQADNVGTTPLVLTNRTSGAPVGYTDLDTDPAQGCAQGCTPLEWPELARLPPRVAAAAAVGILSPSTGRPPRAGDPLPLYALVARLAPPGMDIDPACNELTRCYASFRRDATPAAHRGDCDRELALNLAYACDAAAKDQSASGLVSAAGPSSACDLVAHLVTHAATRAADYPRLQEQAEAAARARPDGKGPPGSAPPRNGKVFGAILGPTSDGIPGQRGGYSCEMREYRCPGDVPEDPLLDVRA